MPRATRPDPYLEEREHYKSLRALVITAMSIIGVVGTVIGLLTFSDSREARQFLKDQNEDLRKAIIQIKDDAQATNNDLREQLKDAKNESKELLKETSTRAITEIEGIKNLATIQAHERVNEVFKQKNLDSYIEQVAQNELSAKVSGMINNELEKVKQIESEKIDQYIASIDGGLNIINRNAMNELLKSNVDFNENQIDRLWNLLNLNFIDGRLRDDLYKVLAEKSFENKSERFKRRILKDATSPNSVNTHCIEYIVSLNEFDEDFYYQLIKTDRIYHSLDNILDKVRRVNPNLGKSILNSKRVVDQYFSNYNRETILDQKSQIVFFTQEFVKPEEQYKYYYFQAIDRL